MTWTFERILKGAAKLNASDVHLVRGVSPVLRVHGEICPIEGEPLDETTLRAILNETTTDRQRETFEEHWQLCFSRYVEGVGRLRASIYYRAGCPEFAIRLCESTVRTAEALGVPPIIEELTRRSSGLVLVTGPTGVGKTTTMNFMIDAINRQRRLKIVTIEDPIEFVHQNARSMVIQQEVTTDVKNYRNALIHALRLDPDVIVIGEMRDLETIETALIAAETGHLVLATLHTPDAVQTVQRIYSVFPAEQQNSIVVQLANSLQAVIAQKLLPRADGRGRVLACEICIATGAVRSHVRDKNPHLLYSEMQTGRKHQMQTMDHALLDLYQRGEISYDVALSNAREPQSMQHKTGR
jgi:twitching motility protein PilT